LDGCRPFSTASERPVIGIIAISAYKLTRKNIGGDRLLWGIYLISATITRADRVGNYLGVRARGRAGLAAARAAQVLNLKGTAPSWARWRCRQPTSTGRCWPGSGFFAKAGAFVFGSGLAIVPFLYGGVVTEHHWLERATVCRSVAGGDDHSRTGCDHGRIHRLPDRRPAGSVAAPSAHFCPATCSRSFRHRTSEARQACGRCRFCRWGHGGRDRHDRRICHRAGRLSVADLPTLLIALAAVAVLLKFKKLPEPLIVAAGATLGLLLFRSPIAFSVISGRTHHE